MPPRAVSVVAAALVAAAALAGCSSTVSMQPAPAANDPGCAAVVARLPDSVAGLARRYTDAQATGAWGDPAAILLTCGVPVPGPSTLPCQTPGGIDWLLDDSEAPRYRFTTFGRDPAIEVYLDYDRVSGFETLTELAGAVAALPATGLTCTPRPAS